MSRDTGLRFETTSLTIEHESSREDHWAKTDRRIACGRIKDEDSGIASRYTLIWLLPREGCYHQHHQNHLTSNITKTLCPLIRQAALEAWRSHGYMLRPSWLRPNPGVRYHLHSVQARLLILVLMWRHFSTSMKASPPSLLLTLPAKTSSSSFLTTAWKRSERRWWWCAVMSAETGLHSWRKCWMRFGIPTADPIPLFAHLNLWRIFVQSMQAVTIQKVLSHFSAPTITSAE